MKRSIFVKTFAVVLAFAIIILLIFAGIVSTFIYDYSTAEKEDTLRNTSEQISIFARVMYENGGVDSDRVEQSMGEIADKNGCAVLLTDAQGNILFSSSPSTLSVVKDKVDEEYMRNVIGGSYYEKRGTLGGIYRDHVYTMGTSVVDENGEMVGAVFVSAATPYTEGLLTRFSQIMVNASLIVLIISLFVSYIVTNEIIRPLKTIYRAVKEYGRGNLKARIPVEGEDEISQLAIAFNDMASNLEQMDQTRSNFLSNVSHDLKTPMTTIGGFVDGILDGTIPPEKEKYYLKIVSDEVRRLSRLVKGLLDVQRFEAGKTQLNLSRFNLCEVVSTVIIGFEQQIDAKNLYIEVHFEKDNMDVVADHDMIFQVVYNLIDNAVKFVNKDGIISIRVVSEGKKMKCYVRNTGDGISSEDIKHIFERFFKTDASRGKDKKGVGLGLYIVRSIIRAHGEVINVESQEDAYCEFSFTLPMA